MAEEQQLSEQESLRLISQMINKAKNSFHDTGIGPILWGSVIALCSLVTFARVQFGFKLPFDIWLLTLVAILPQIIITYREKKMRRARNYDDAAIDYIWLSFGIAIFLMAHINIVFINKLEEIFKAYKVATGHWPDFNLNDYTASLMLLLYGFPTVITGAIMKFKPMLWGGIAGWLCCIISVYTPAETDMLLTAFAAVVMWLVPGIILWVKYKKKKAKDV
jgi:uncharacterized protein with PQ loop repeat